MAQMMPDPGASAALQARTRAKFYPVSVTDPGVQDHHAGEAVVYSDLPHIAAAAMHNGPDAPARFTPLGGCVDHVVLATHRDQDNPTTPRLRSPAALQVPRSPLSAVEKLIQKDVMDAVSRRKLTNQICWLQRDATGFTR
ncbi:hypothetical protein E2I00_001254 [Balaenoptera physalus]|uniref:Uncharacterized protein n=1 Tax=Balaenoptera physalus TaxID=9770 RepID=A0A643BTK7_BALPH|nr:hypothetical protein E2I00_001254 [Balaenoptera physalus]